jgi:Acyl-CoA dehydrogenase, C-terminal domain
MIVGDERELLAQTLAQATEAASGDGARGGEALDRSLGEIGWRHALDDDVRTAVSLLFERQGRTGTTSSALDAVLARALGGDASTDVAVVLPPIGATEPPGRSTGAGLDVHGLGTRALRQAPVAWIACASDGGGSCVGVPTEDLVLRSIRGMDPDLGLVEVVAEGATAARSPAPGAMWSDAVAVGQLALAHELAGASWAMLELARDHAVERIQFGQPIARFQAVRHRLADALVAVEAAAAAAGAAWEDGSPLAAAAAKAIAGRGALEVARHAQQVLAGIGFTTEHPLHRYVRRAVVLDGLLGDSRSLTRAMGEDLLRTRQVPPLLPL